MPGSEVPEQRHVRPARALHESQHKSADDEGQPAAKGGSDHEHADRKRDLRTRKAVRDERGRGRREYRLPDPHPDPREQHLHEAARQPAHRRQRTPNEDTCRDEPGAGIAIGEHRDRHAGNREKQREDAIEPADLAVARVQVGLQGRNDDSDDLPVDVGDQRGEHQHSDDEPGVRRPWVIGRRGGTLGAGRGRSFRRMSAAPHATPDRRMPGRKRV